MSDNDSVKRREVLNHLGDLFTLCSETGGIAKKDLEIFEKIIKSLPAVPQEMSAREFVMVQRRLCNKYNMGTTECTGCPLDGREVCGKFLLDGTLIEAVEQWAREYPEEVNNGR